MERAVPDYPGNFYMLGIIHRDRRNPDIIRQWLEKLKPDVITVEVSRYSLDFRHNAGKMYREKLDGICSCLSAEGYGPANPCFEDLYAFLETPPEFTAADDYHRRNNAFVYPVDMDLFSFLKLRSVGELINGENLRKALAGASENIGTTERVLADLFFHKGVAAFSYDEEMAIRDRSICHKIGILRKRHGDARFVHIAGWRHLRDPLSLYGPFGPVKIFAYD